MKILVVSNLYPPNAVGGAEILTATLVAGLRENHSVTVLTSRSNHTYGDGVIPLLRLSKRYPEPLTQPLFDMARLAAASHFNYQLTKSMIRRTNPDVVFLSDLKRLGLGPLHAAQHLRPTATFLHDSYALNIGGPSRPGWRRWVYFTASSMALCGPSTVQFALANSQHTIDTQHPTMRIATSKAVGVGISTPSNLDEIVSKYPKGSERGPVIFYIGRIERAKGIHDIIHAASLLISREKLTGLELRIAGFENDPGYRRELEEQANREGIPSNVKFLGKISEEEKYRQLSAADIMVFASNWNEGHGQTYLEAMFCATPCVCVPAGGASEVLRDGENCLTFPPNNAEELAKACFEMLTNRPLRDRLVENARRLALERFTATAFSKRCENALLECVTLWNARTAQDA